MRKFDYMPTYFYFVALFPTVFLFAVSRLVLSSYIYNRR